MKREIRLGVVEVVATVLVLSAAIVAGAAIPLIGFMNDLDSLRQEVREAVEDARQ